MGIFLLIMTLGVEVLGTYWSYYYGSHRLAWLATLVNGLIGISPRLSQFHVTATQIGWDWVALYILLHLVAVIASLRTTTRKRLKMGSPERFISTVDRIYQELATASPAPGLSRVTHLNWPRTFDYAPGAQDFTISFLWFRMTIGEGLLTHRDLKPLLAQHLFAWNTGDVWLRVILACLEPLTLLVLPLGILAGLPVGIGPALTFLLWKKYWRDRVYAGDLFAARLGQLYELIEALDQVVRPRERRKNLFLRESPYASERIGRLMRLIPTGYSRTYAKTSGAASSDTTEGRFRTDEQATSGYASGGAHTPSHQHTSSERAAHAQSTASETAGFSAGKTTASPNAASSSAPPPRSEERKMPKTNFEGWDEEHAAHRRSRSRETRASEGGSKRQKTPASEHASHRTSHSQRKKSEWNAGYAAEVTLTLEFADAGWHLRWGSPNTDAFWATLEEFKNRIDLTERYFDPFLFEDRGGWWVAYGALAQVSDLFANYQSVREDLERAYQQQYEEQVRRNRERSARERQEQQTRQQYEQKSGWQQETSSGQRAGTGSQKQQQPPPKREEIKLPRTSGEAFALLGISPPVTHDMVKRAYREKAKQCHPDMGGSHAQMVVINAAFELAQRAAS
jgi:hypothetical protein